MCQKTHALCQGQKQSTKYFRQVTSGEKKNQLVQTVHPAEGLSNRPMLLKLVKPQLLRDSILSCAGHLLKTHHLPEMPHSIQDQLEKVDSQLLGHYGKTLNKVQDNSCSKGRNEARITEQFAKKGGRPTPKLLCKGTAQNQVL